MAADPGALGRVGPSRRQSDAGGKGRHFATGRAIFQGYHLVIPLTVAYSAIFVTTGQEQHRESDEKRRGEGRQVRFRRADRRCPRQVSVAVAKHGCPVVVVMAVKEFERLTGQSKLKTASPAKKDSWPCSLQPPNIDPRTMKLTLQQLEAHLWGAANILRGKTAGQDYKNYILSLMFFKRLCDQWEGEADNAIAELERQQGRSFTVETERGRNRHDDAVVPYPNINNARRGDVVAFRHLSPMTYGLNV
jgi:hypothetical protein